MQVIDIQGAVTKPHFVLIYGKSGSGKTHLCGTLGELGNVLFIDIDQGHETLRCAPTLEKARGNITVVSFEAFGDLDKAYKAVAKNDPANWERIFNQGKRDNEGKPITPEHKDYHKVETPFDWVVWDTWTHVQHYMKEGLRTKESKDPFNGTIGFRKNISQPDWGSLSDINDIAVVALRDCSVNQVFIMQEILKILNPGKANETVVKGPAIHGQMVERMPSYFDVVVHTDTDTMGRFTQTTKAKSGWIAKSRRGPGADFTGATMKEVLNIV